jgi:hypothetical protein
MRQLKTMCKKANKVQLPEAKEHMYAHRVNVIALLIF